VYETKRIPYTTFHEADAPPQKDSYAGIVEAIEIDFIGASKNLM